MKRTKRICALVLAATVVCSMFAIPKAYGAVGVDTMKNDCKIEINVSTDQFSELDDISIPVELYKVADIGVGADYTLTTEFDIGALEGIENVSSTTPTETWTELAAIAKEIVDSAKEANNPITFTKDASIVNGKATIENLPVGLYLVDAQKTLSSTYEYTFIPYLISLPNNYYAGTDTSDEWVYELTGSNAIGLKPEKADRYGDLEINKSLNAYNETLGGATFVFQVEATKTDVDDKTNTPVPVYSNVVSLTFKGPGTESILIENLPAGAVVTVTEIYSGAAYELEDASAGTQTVTIVAKEESEVEQLSEATAATNPVEVSFSNTHDGGMKGGNGVVNSFSYDNGEWTCTPKEESLVEDARTAEVESDQP